MDDDKLWYKDAIIYELHVKAFYDSSGDGIGDFKGLTQKLDYLQELGITAIWLLPFYPSPLKDDGYDIANYTDIHPSYGNLQDFKVFLKEAHRRNLKVITELVINHTSDQHPWFQKARQSEKGSIFRDFYVWNDSPEKYTDARIIFQDFEKSNWTWDPVAKSYFWHRFYSHQPDLNFENPLVKKAIFRILHFWLKMGVDGLRLDAVPYLYEKEGTNCENLPETHAFLKELRKYVDDNFENKMLLAEANQWPEEAAHYFGNGDECHLAFHFPVMPRLFMSLQLEDTFPIIEITKQTPQIPDNCQWALFLRNHDELTLEMVTDEERDYMFRIYGNDPQARINLGIRRRLAPLLRNDRRKIELMNALLFSLIGTPVIYYGDEIGMGDNIYLGDRNGVRTPMQWSGDRNGGFSKANPQKLFLPPIIDPEYHFTNINVEAQQSTPYSLFFWMRQMIYIRKKYKAFGRGNTQFLKTNNHKVLSFVRSYKDEIILTISNLSRFVQYVEIDLSDYKGSTLVELFSGSHFPTIKESTLFITLSPYNYYWFSIEKETVKENSDIPRFVVTKQAEKIFTTSYAHILEGLLRSYILRKHLLKRRRKTVQAIKIFDHFSIDEAHEHRGLHLAIMQILYENQESTYILFFLGIGTQEDSEKINLDPSHKIATLIIHPTNQQKILYEISENAEDINLFKNYLTQKKRIKGLNGEVRFESFIRNGKNSEKGVENFKIIKYIEEPRSLDIEMRKNLFEKTTFRGFYPLTGYAIHRVANSDVQLGFIERLAQINHTTNAWVFAVEEAERYLERMATSTNGLSHDKVAPFKKWTELAEGSLDTDIAKRIETFLNRSHDIGNLLADLHLSIENSSDSTFFAPDKFTIFYQRSLSQTIRQKFVLAMETLKKKKDSFYGEDLKKVETILSCEQNFIRYFALINSTKITSTRQRIHGNFTLDALDYNGQDFFIRNFEGNLDVPPSQRRFKRSPLRDVISMLYSLFAAGYTAAENEISRGVLTEQLKKSCLYWAKSWSLWGGSSLLHTYFKRCSNAQFFPINHNTLDYLLGFYFFEKIFDSIIKSDFLNEKNLQLPLDLLEHFLYAYHIQEY